MEISLCVTVWEKDPHKRARPTIHTIDELSPCNTRANAIMARLGASINITWEPRRAIRPIINGTCRDVYLSEKIARGIVARE